MPPTTSLSRRAFLAAAVAAPFVAWARPSLGAPLEDAFDELVSKQGLKADEPGLAVLVRKPGKVSLQRCAGLARVADKAPITARTTFELASATKPIAATAMLILHDRGKLSVHDDVRKHIPELPVYAEGKPIKVTDLLHHISGLPDYMRIEQPAAGQKGYLNNEDFAPEFARQKDKHPLLFPTGAKYEYNNTNYMLLGLIVARVSKKSFGTFLKDEVFGPAGMADSFVYEAKVASLGATEAERAPAIGYRRRPLVKTWSPGWGVPPTRNETLLTVGDGGVWKNLQDMARWDDAIRDHKLIKPETMKLALTPSKTADGETNQYGLGWSLFPDGSGKLRGFGHNGSWGGFRTSYYRGLTTDRSTVVLSNRGDFNPDAFWYPLNEIIEKHL